MYQHRPAPPRLAARALGTLTVVTLVSLSACGDSGSATSGDAGTSEADSDDASSTDAEGSSTGGTTAAGDSSSGGPILLCDGGTVENLFDCEPCTECGSWDDTNISDSYPAALQCMLEGMRDRALVSGSKVTCQLMKCTDNRFAVTMESSMLNQLRVYDEGMPPNNYFAPVEYTLKDPDYFESCLHATDPAEVQPCASPSNWFVEQLGEHESLVCP